MADSTEPPSPSGTQQRPSPAHSKHQRRNNNRNRRSNHFDGAVSDGAAFNPAASPHSKNTQHKHQRASFASGAVSDHHHHHNNNNNHNNIGEMNAQKHRPASMNAGQALATPAKEQAYAGPTFQASPAASSLPIPRYFSKSLPNNAVQPSLQSRLSAEKTPEEQVSSPDPEMAAPAVPRESQQSPLDFFFKADRAEKERIRNGTGSFSPESARRPPPPSTEPRNVYQQQERGIFLQELDGGDGSMPSPRTVPPDSRPGPPERGNSFPSRLNESDSERQARTRNLKELLFNAVLTPPPSRGHDRDNSGSQTPDEFVGSPSPFQRSPSGPSTPQPSSNQHSNYSLHYGNRNLSPLFKAARSETPPRPSSLRQEVSDHSPGADVNAVARSYLQEHIRTSRPTEMPQISFGDRPRPPQGPNALPTPVPASVQPGGQQPGGSHGPDFTHNGGSDVRGMEENLRRILKIA